MKKYLLSLFVLGIALTSCENYTSTSHTPGNQPNRPTDTRQTDTRQTRDQYGAPSQSDAYNPNSPNNPNNPNFNRPQGGNR
jgi:hypothetical protein